YDFGNPSGSGVRLEFHLPQTVHGGDIALSEVEVVVVLREDVRHQEAVVDHRYRFLQPRDVQLLFAFITAGMQVLPESLKRVQKLSEWGDGNASDCPAAVKKKNQQQGNRKACKKLRKFHSERKI